MSPSVGQVVLRGVLRCPLLVQKIDHVAIGEGVKEAVLRWYFLFAQSCADHVYGVLRIVRGE